MAGKHPSIRGMAGTLVTSWLPAYTQVSMDTHVLIASQTVGAGGAASITFSLIPSTFKHLQIRGIVSTGSTTSNILIQCNGDTGTNYAWHYARGDGANATSSAGATQTSMLALALTGSTTAFGALVTDILDYTSTSKNKTIRALGGQDLNGSGIVALDSGLWCNSTIAAVTSLTITPSTGSLAQYSTFALYGLN